MELDTVMSIIQICSTVGGILFIVGVMSAKISGLGKSLDEVKVDVRAIKGGLHSLDVRVAVLEPHAKGPKP